MTMTSNDNAKIFPFIISEMKEPLIICLCSSSFFIALADSSSGKKTLGKLFIITL